MNTGEFAHVLVTLNVPPTLEEVVIDWLLSRDDASGFTSFPVSGHGGAHHHLSAAEQVTGKERRLHFQVQIPARAVAGFITGARQAFGAAGVHYWVAPLLVCGHLTPDGAIEPV